MPNWCSNKMVVYGPREELMRFFEDMRRAVSPERKCAYFKTGWGDKWLGNLFHEAGYSLGDAFNNRGSRGYVQDIILNENPQPNVVIFYESAWCPSNMEFGEMLAKFYPTLEEVTLAEECGCEIFVNTDSTGEFLPERFMLDNDGDCSYFNDEESLVSAFNETFGTTCHSVAECCADANGRGDVWVREFTAE